MIGDRIFRLIRSKKINQNEKSKLNKYYKEIIEIFNTKNHDTTENRLHKILYKYDKIPRPLKRFIRHKIVPDFERLTQFMHNPKITHNQPNRKLLQTNTTQSNQKKIQTNHRTKQLPTPKNAKMDTKTSKRLTPNNFTTPQ
jgi:hypothetical protein